MSSKEIIENLWEQKDTIDFIKDSNAKDAVDSILDQLDGGT